MLMETEGFPHQTPGPVTADRVPQFFPGGEANPERLGRGWMIKQCYRLSPDSSTSPV